MLGIYGSMSEPPRKGNRVELTPTRVLALCGAGNSKPGPAVLGDDRTGSLRPGRTVRGADDLQLATTQRRVGVGDPSRAQ